MDASAFMFMRSLSVVCYSLSDFERCSMVRVWLVVCGVGFSGVAQAACPWEGSASSFFRCLMDMSEVVDENEVAVADHEGRLNGVEDALWDLSAVAVSAADVLSTVAGEGYALLVDIAPVGLTGSFADLVDVPSGLADGDDDTLAMLVCPDGQVAVAFGGGWVCGEPPSGDVDGLAARVEALEMLAGASSSGILYGDYSISNSVDLAGMGGFTEITGGLNISSGMLPSLETLSSLTTIGGTLWISDSDGLEDLDGLHNLTSIGEGLYISSNDALTSLDGLDSLTSLGGDLSIYGNDALTNVDALSAVTSVGNNLYIEFNPVLEDVDGLSSVTSVGDWLRIQNNGGLLHLDGFSSLTSVGGWVQIEYNDSLMNCDGMVGLTTINGTMELTGNYALTSLGFSNVELITGNLGITSNTALCQSQVDAFYEGVVVEGDWEEPHLYGNNDGC